MSQGWIVAGLVALAWYVSVPETVVYHGSRVARRPIEPTRTVLETEIDRAADAYGLRRAVLRALVRVESAFNPKAVSRVGARGVAQILPSNAKRCKLPDSDHLWDPTYNVRCGAQILREEIDRLGNLEDALTVYNCGKTKCAEGRRYALKVIALSKTY